MNSTMLICCSNDNSSGYVMESSDSGGEKVASGLHFFVDHRNYGHCDYSDIYPKTCTQSSKALRMDFTGARNRQVEMRRPIIIFLTSLSCRRRLSRIVPPTIHWDQ